MLCFIYYIQWRYINTLICAHLAPHILLSFVRYSKHHLGFCRTPRHPPGVNAAHSSSTYFNTCSKRSQTYGTYQAIVHEEYSIAGHFLGGKLQNRWGKFLLSIFTLYNTLHTRNKSQMLTEINVTCHKQLISVQGIKMVTIWLCSLVPRPSCVFNVTRENSGRSGPIL